TLGCAVHVFDAGFADIDSTFEIRAVFDADALADDVSAERTFIADFSAVAGGHISFDFAQDHDFLGVDVGLDLAVAAYSHAMAGKVDGAFHAAVNVQRFRTADLTFDDERLANRGLFLVVDYGVAWRGNGRGLGRQGAAGVHKRFLLFRRGRLRGWARRISGLPHFEYFLSSWLFECGAQPAFAVCLSVVKKLRMPRRPWHVSSQTFGLRTRTSELLDWPDLSRSPQADQDCEDLIVAV